MKTEIKDKWLKALRSGEYKQGKTALKTNDKFCCLGVLCDLYIKENPTASWKERVAGDDIFNFVSEKQSKMDILPQEVMDWSGLNNNNPDMPNGKPLAGLNDGGSTFEELAVLIESHL